ncbi:MAG TPA: hydroxyacid-oxoacid transhydrogenase [Streptosporangiaceae bacterium]|nr:hydroxyacid-oxoacid transhydrogenase [Streptosporangiaceae bacterium]
MAESQEAVFPAETIVTWQASPVRFGLGATRDIGYELRGLGMTSVLLITDRHLSRIGLPQRVGALVEASGIAVKIYDGTKIEPSDRGCTEAARAIDPAGIDGYVAVGGGSSIDTAKVVNLLHSYPEGDLSRYLNRPMGDGSRVPGPLRPLVAVPTTSGTGSECTAMVALEVTAQRVKTGIADSRLHPSAAIVDPLNTVTAPPAVTAASGYDVLCHACESYTARPFDRRPPYAAPEQRPIYVGANPISDLWAERALELVGRYFRRAVLNPDDIEARTGMSQAALFAGMGFGNAGTHIPHACAYPVGGMVRDYVPDGYPMDHALVPHGQAVIVTAPAAFAFTYPAAPERHERAAQLLGGPTVGGADALPEAIRGIVRDTGGPSGLAAFGYTTADLPGLVEGGIKQQRLLACCPRPADARDLRRVLQASMVG